LIGEIFLTPVSLLKRTGVNLLLKGDVEFFADFGLASLSLFRRPFMFLYTLGGLLG
jgi:hypothetical protein